jgi:hypothetical protein
MVHCANGTLSTGGADRGPRPELSKKQSHRRGTCYPVTLEPWRFDHVFLRLIALELEPCCVLVYLHHGAPP